jgi:hypothetical protein
MHSVPRILLLAFALTGWAVADLPKKAPNAKYTRLWIDSPFTSKPPPPETGPVTGPFEDYSLAGVSPVTGGYRVTLLNKKKPEERIIVESDRPNEGFKVLGVIRKEGDPLGTVVRMSSSAGIGTVSFDTKLLALATAPPPKANPQLPPGVNAGIPGQPLQPGQIVQPGQQPGQPLNRQPRPRVVPPPVSPVPQKPVPTNPSSSNHRPVHRAQR